MVQRMGGWAKPDVLLKHYAAVTSSAQRKALRVLDRLTPKEKAEPKGEADAEAGAAGDVTAAGDQEGAAVGLA